MGDNTVMPFHVLGVLVKPFDCFHRQHAREKLKSSLWKIVGKRGSPQIAGGHFYMRNHDQPHDTL